MCTSDTGLNADSDSKGTKALSCCLIGAGNVATHLGRALAGAGVEVCQVFSRRLPHAAELATQIGAQAIDSLQLLTSDADLYIVSVPDDAIGGIVAATDSNPASKTALWVHTSGSCDMSVFAGRKERFGVFYPLQTFSKNKPVDLSSLPLLLETNSEADLRMLEEVAGKLSGRVCRVNSEQRRTLHIAAVFACNFVNYLWLQSAEILNSAELDFSLLQPLLAETLDKLNDLSPGEAQTGPARRGDLGTIKRHLAMLYGNRAELYKTLSNNILQLYGHQPVH